jgi:hypothetical protein
MVPSLLKHLIPSFVEDTVTDPSKMVVSAMTVLSDVVMTPTTFSARCGPDITIRFDQDNGPRFEVITTLLPIDEDVYHVTVDNIPVTIMISEGSKNVVITTEAATLELLTRLGTTQLTYYLLTGEGNFRYYPKPQILLVITHLQHPSVERITWYNDHAEDSTQRLQDHVRDYLEDHNLREDMISVMITTDDYREPMMIRLHRDKSLKSIYYYVYKLYHSDKPYDRVPIDINHFGSDNGDFDSEAWLTALVTLLE